MWGVGRATPLRRRLCAQSGRGGRAGGGRGGFAGRVAWSRRASWQENMRARIRAIRRQELETARSRRGRNRVCDDRNRICDRSRRVCVSGGVGLTPYKLTVADHAGMPTF